MVPDPHAGTPHRVSSRGLERAHPLLVCVLIREMGGVDAAQRTAAPPTGSDSESKLLHSSLRPFMNAADTASKARR